MIDGYHFDKTPEEAERETPVGDFSDALYAAADAVASTILGWHLAYATVCPGWAERYRYREELERGTWEYEPSPYTSMVSHDDEPGDEDTSERIRDRMVRDATTLWPAGWPLKRTPARLPTSSTSWLTASTATTKPVGSDPSPRSTGPKPRTKTPRSSSRPRPPTGIGTANAPGCSGTWSSTRLPMWWQTTTKPSCVLRWPSATTAHSPVLGCRRSSIGWKGPSATRHEALWVEASGAGVHAPAPPLHWQSTGDDRPPYDRLYGLYTLFMWFLCSIIVSMSRFWKMDGERLRRLRKERLLTQVELSEMTGVAQDSISALETGKREAHPETIRKLAKALGVNPRDLIKEQEY